MAPSTLPSAASPSPVVLQTGSGLVLTVGAGMEFATLSDALKASADGDTIAVKAGTYTNDFCLVTTQVRIVAMGGVVNEVATVPPPNGKGLITVDANLSIQGFTFTGGADSSPDGNISGIRLENGSLNVSYCYFHDMQEGLLCGIDNTPSSTVTIDHSEFARNGTGDGYSHNIYVGPVAALTITNSYFHGANVGHEIKSRAAVTTITNNLIADGPTGTASYDIDLPNAGVGLISGNIIEKGPAASNQPAIHYGGENQYSWANNSLTVIGNTILNDFGAGGIGVLNQSAANGLSVAVNLTNNSLWGFDPARLVLGAGTLAGNTTLASEPAYAIPKTWSVPPAVTLSTGPALLNLSTGNHTITGGEAKLTVNDTAGNNILNGGTGGLTVTAAVGWDMIATRAGATDTLTLTGRNSTVHSAGTDHIVAAGLYEEVDATGAATITGANFSTYNLSGAELLTSSQSCVLNVGQAGNVHFIDLGGDTRLTELAGGHLTIVDQTATASIAGAVTGWASNAGLLSFTTGGTGAYVLAGTGRVSVTGGAGADTLTAGAGNGVFGLGGGADHMVFGSGAASVTGGAGHDTYHFHAGSHGQDTVTGFKQGIDTLSFEGFAGAAVASGTVAGGNTSLILADGTTILFTGVALAGYGGGTQPPPTVGGGTGGGTVGGTVTLTSGGQTVLGTTAALSVVDLAGGNTITGGTGGLSVMAGANDVLGTAAASTNKLTLSSSDTLAGAGTDQVTATGRANFITESGTARVTLLGTNAVVRGGAGLLSVTDAIGGASIAGGSGGLQASLAGGSDTVSTASGAFDTISLTDHTTLLSRGTDRISVTGLYAQITQTGTAAISQAGGVGLYDLEGTATLATTGSALVTVGQHASATIGSANFGDVGIGKLAGGNLVLTDSVAGGGSGGLNLGGGQATVWAAASGALSVTTGAQGVVMIAGGGNVTLNGGSGNDAITGGSGQAVLNLGQGADTVTLGHGSITVSGGHADTFVIPGSADGTLVVDNWTAQDQLVAPGGQPDLAIAAQSVVAGSLWLTVASGAHIELVGVTHFL